MKKDISILLIEDNPGDARLIREMLAEAAPWRFGLEYADRLAAGTERIVRGGYDIVLLDLGLPDSQGLDTLSALLAAAPSVPVVVLTGLVDEDTGLRAVNEGAQDYLVKGQTDGNLLARAIRYAIERRRAEEALRESENKYRTLVDNSPVGIYRSNLDGRFEYVNGAMVEIFEAGSVEEMLSVSVLSRYKRPGDREALIKLLRDRGRVRDFEIEIITKTGKTKTALLSAVLEDHILSGMVMDITEQKKLENQLRQSQKMEAIGQLAGGVAHDFNNILTAILGYSHILYMKMAADDPLRIYIANILESVDRATTLTHSLLAFSRKQVMNLRDVDVNQLIKRMQGFLSRIIGEDVELRTVPHTSEVGGEPLTVVADSGQIEQVLLNLATNARDAMTAGGQLVIGAQEVEMDESFVEAHGYGEPGRYACISVADNGTGMDEEMRRRIFEPFFTTKEMGKGTGLGLAVVYGIVKQHNGYINVYSEPGKGTTFKIYLPSVHARQQEEMLPPEAIEIKGGTETVLVAEDDPVIRKLVTTELQEFGYRVITAKDGEDAVRKFEEKKADISLVILDMVMPKKSGKEAYEEIRGLRPGIKTIFTSGYTADKMRNGELTEGLEFILKPVSPRDLLRKVREVLDRDRGN